MSFKSLERILTALEKQPGWEKQQQYRRLLQSWQEIVEPQIAPHTRPLYIARQVLWVATSSSVWAQTLSLQRYTLLQKLNAQLPEKLADIRFSSAQWYDRLPAAASSPASATNSPQHPSRVVIEEEQSLSQQLSAAETPELALQNWLEKIRTRSRHLPLCPQCQSPTPPGELQRWGCCTCCTSKQWAHLP